MNLQLFIGLLFATLPVMELRASIPLIVDYCIGRGVSYMPYIILAILLNIVTILIVFLFLDFLHHRLLDWKIYKKGWDYWVHNRLRRKVEQLDKKNGLMQYMGLLLFIALPLPGTGVWTSATIAWLLGMDKTKSFFTLAIGAAIAGIIITIITLGFLGIPH